jgi:tetratricopeptide (TPR) repeat protein
MTETNEENKNDTLVCLSCGAEVSLDEGACPVCGSDRHLMQSGTGASELPVDSASPRRTRPAVMSTLAVLVVLAISLVLINALDKPTSGSDTTPDEIDIDAIADSPPLDETEREIVESLSETPEDDFGSLAADGAWHALRGEWHEAILSYEKALALRNDDVEAIEGLVRAYIEIDDIDNALFHIDRWIEMYDSDPIPHALKGSILYGQGEYEGARDEYRAALYRTGAGDDAMKDYSEKLIEINDVIEEQERLAEEAAKYDIGEGWVHIDKEEIKPTPKPEPEAEPGTGPTPFSQFLEKPDDDGTVLIGEGEQKGDAGETAEPTEGAPAEEVPRDDGGQVSEDKAVEDSSTVETEDDEGKIDIEISEDEARPQHVRITGARYDSSPDEFSLYLDTMGRASPRCYYDEPNLVFWLTISNAECDFTSVPLERTFTNSLVSSIRAWADDEGNTRFKIILNGPVGYSSPTILSLGLSLHLMRTQTEDYEDTGE